MTSEIKSLPVTRPPSPYPSRPPLLSPQKSVSFSIPISQLPKITIPRTKEKHFEALSPDLMAPRNADKVDRIALSTIVEDKK